MSVHQIIYTSCMRGINGVNDGQQVYSYDATFKDVNNDEIKSLFTYQHPSLETGVIMSEEIALTMPKSFVYRRLENGTCALALNTYLGRDYMGSAGRFGNHLSHVIAFDPEDATHYPAEYYGSEMLRNRMEYSEVNNPNRPDYLPTPHLERGFAVDVDAVIDFLSVDDRLEIYKNMLHAMLSFESERKRVVICDEPENIILWIAALEFALPLKNTLNINFSTYDFDPALSSSQICGVVPSGTRYNADSHRLHFVFDLLENRSAEFDKDEDFYDFIDTALSFSYESLQDFHSFLCDGYQYDKADERLYSAYTLYSMLSDGIGAITIEKLNNALSFADDFAVSAETVHIVQQLMTENEVMLRGDKDIFLRVIKYIVKHAAELDASMVCRLKELVVDKILCEFLNDNVVEEAFVKLYQQINTICSQHGFSVATELMQSNNRAKLFAVMRQNIATWKIAFIIRVISDYVKDQKLPVSELLIDTQLGQIYYGIVRAVYTQGQQNGFFVVSKILEAFSGDCTYLVNMGLNLEGMLLDLPNGNQEVASMWKYFGQIMLTSQSDHFDTAYTMLGSYQRYDQVFMLYNLALSRATSPEMSCSIFEKHCRSFVLKDQAYATKYYVSVLEVYYRNLLNYDAESTYSAKAEMFSLLVTQRIDADFADELIKELIRPIPLDCPSKSDAKLIQEMFKYTYNFRQKPISGKLLLLIIGMVLEGVKGKQRLYDKLDQLEKLTLGNKADLSRTTEKSVQNYFDWLLPSVCELCDRSADLEAVYRLFEMPAAVEAMFFAQCTRIYLKQSKGEKDYAVFCEFLSVVFDNSTSQSREEVGKVLCKLNKQKMEGLDFAVTDYFRMDGRALRCWDEIRNTAESTNPLLNNLSNLFKRRKD